MINQENLNKLYSGIIDGKELTTKELNGFGFTSKDLSTLIEQGKLTRIKRGYYSFEDIESLFHYGKELIAMKDYDKATNCFRLCYKLNPKHRGTCFQLFYRSINSKEYDKTFEYFDTLMETDNRHYLADSNFFLYLLSFVTELPDKYKGKVNNLKLEDIRVDFTDKRYMDIPLQNKIRLSSLNKRFYLAATQLNELIIKHDNNIMAQELLIKNLLNQIRVLEGKRKLEILELVKNHEYTEVINCLNANQNIRGLDDFYKHASELANVFINISAKGIIPKCVIDDTERLDEAIQGRNYQLALKLCKDYNRKINVEDDKNAITVMLSDICTLIDNVNIKEERVVKSPATFYDVITSLVNSDFDNAFIKLKEYMVSINKSEYEFLIANLIKLSIIEKDCTFTKSMVTLTNLSRDDFTFDLSNYIQDFYINLSQNKLEEAKIYLDIIQKSKNLGHDGNVTEALLQILEITESKLNQGKNKESCSIKVPEQINIPREQPKSNDVDRTKEPIVKSPVPEEKEALPLVNVRDSEREFINSKYELLLKYHGIILLKPMNNERIARITNIVKEYPEMVSFTIGNDDEKRIVLRYKKKEMERVDIKELINEGNKAYAEGDYDTCIKKCLKLLQFGNPPAVGYAKLGLAHMKKWNIKLAIDYLTVATELGKKEKSDTDFSYIIARLKGNSEEEEYKPNFIMKEKHFEDDLNKHYEINNFDEINAYIESSGLDVESACKQLGINSVKINTIRLIYSKMYYAQGSYDKGDEFLKAVEQSHDKTEFTIKLADKIRKTKKFYAYREQENPKVLSLKLKAKK